MPKSRRDTSTDPVIYGTSGNDILSGLGGKFILSGGKGDDTYIVDGDDTIDEKARSGVDRVISSVSYTLGANLENLTLDGTDPLSGTGNDLANEIIGNSGDNALYGLGGDDILTGGGGSDFIDGGDGDDTAIFSGPLAGYRFVWSGGDLLVEGPDGETDILRSIEYLAFDDRVVAATSLGGAAAPVAVADAAAVAEDGSVTVQVLGNDTGDGIAVASASNGAFGSVAVSAGGSVIYTPDANAHGTDVFSYTIVDALGVTATASVTVVVASVNDAPVAMADSYSAVAGAVYSSVTSVLANDRDVDGDALSILSFSAASASGGAVQMNANGTFSYTPAVGFAGADSFTYVVGDGNGGAASATVSIMVADPSEPPYYVDGLLYDLDAKRLNYPADPGASVTVTYAFLANVPDYYSPTDPRAIQDTFHAFTLLQQEAAREILAQIESFTNVTFVEVSDASAATLTFGFYDLGGDSLGAATYPVGASIGTVYSDIWIDAQFTGDAFAQGTEAFYVLAHEIGHAIGIDHPSLPALEENRQFTVMDYSPHPTMSGDVTGYQLYDIAALQYLYGANADFASGDDVYRFSDVDGAIKTIWDGGGHDVLDMSAATYGVDINLAGGAFSTVTANGANNLAIAFGTLIEDAIGGAYDDRIAGNAADNRLTGGGGDDVFAFAADWGDDTITDFARGKDMLDFSAAGLTFADFDIASSHGDTTISYLDDSVVLLGVQGVDATDFFVA